MSNLYFITYNYISFPPNFQIKNRKKIIFRTKRATNVETFVGVLCHGQGAARSEFVLRDQILYIVLCRRDISVEKNNFRSFVVRYQRKFSGMFGLCFSAFPPR